MKSEYYSYIINIVLVILAFFITYYGWKKDKARGRNASAIKNRLQVRIITFTILVAVLNICNYTIEFLKHNNNNNNKINSISGRTVDIESNEIISRVKISYDKVNSYVCSDDVGNFTIELEKFEYGSLIQLYAEKSGYKPKKVLLDFPRTDIVIQMQKEMSHE